MRNKILAFLTAAAATLPLIKTYESSAVNFTMRGTLYSDSALVINLDCDTIIHEKNADTKQLPGPLVNIMTAVVCMENCEDLSQEITIDEDVYSYLYNTDYPDDLSEYDLIIQCGACMFNRRYVLSRIDRARSQGVPMTNYGITIAHLTGILDKIVIDYK